MQLEQEYLFIENELKDETSFQASEIQDLVANFNAYDWSYEEIAVCLKRLAGLNLSEENTKVLLSKLASVFKNNYQRINHQEYLDILTCFSDIKYVANFANPHDDHVSSLLFSLCQKLKFAKIKLSLDDMIYTLKCTKNISSSCSAIKPFLEFIALEFEASPVALNISQLSDAFASIKNKNPEKEQVALLLKQLTLNLNKLKGPFNPTLFVHIYRMLRGRDIELSCIRELYAVLSEKIVCTEPSLNIDDIIFILTQLQHRDPGLPAIELNLLAIVNLIRQDVNAIGIHEITQILSLLQAHGSQTAAMQAMIMVLAAKLEKAVDSDLTEELLEKLLKALHQMDAESIAVQSFLSALISKLKNSPNTFKITSIANGFYGLRNLNLTSSVVKEFINCLTEKLIVADDEITGPSFANILFGLQSMNAETVTVQSLLRIITQKISSTNAVFDGISIGKALYGLNQMSTGNSAVKGLLVAITTKINASQMMLQPLSIANALYGLQNMQVCPQLIGLVSALKLKFSTNITLSYDEEYDEDMSWCQIAASYLKLLDNQVEKEVPASIMFILGEKKTEISQKCYFKEHLKKLFLDTLKPEKIRIQDGDLLIDLHRLDHLSAKYFLQLVLPNKNSIQPYKKVICGRGSHSNSASKLKMANLLIEHLQSIGLQTNIDYTWAYDFGSIQFRKHQNHFFKPGLDKPGLDKSAKLFKK